MQKRFVIIIISLLPMLCIGQMAMPDLTAAIVSGTDSNQWVQEFSHSIKDYSRVLLSWRMNDSSSVEFVTVERSSNGSKFEAVGALKMLRTTGVIEWSDDAPPKGNNYYRLAFVSPAGGNTYSKTIAVSIGSDKSIKFYPNPVDNILIIRTDVPLEIQIADATGKIKIPLTKVSGLYTLNVSSLEKGVYVLRIINKQTNSMMQEKLIKN